MTSILNKNYCTCIKLWIFEILQFEGQISSSTLPHLYPSLLLEKFMSIKEPKIKSFNYLSHFYWNPKMYQILLHEFKNI